MLSPHNLGTIPWYSKENPMAGAIMAYSGRKAMVKTKDPGIAVGVEVMGREGRDELTTPLDSGPPTYLLLCTLSRRCERT